MKVLTIGTPAAYNDTFVADCTDKDGNPVRAIIHCSSLQMVNTMLRIEELTALKIS